MTSFPRRSAALDLGTNSFHLVVAEVDEGGTLRTITREKAMLRLGDEVATTGRIGPEAQEAALDAVSRLASIARAQGVEELLACATAAIREAENGASFVDALESETGVSVQVISGEQEARLIFRAMQASVDFGGERLLGVDIGGGSVELMVGGQRDLDWVTSLRLGVGRLTAQFVHSDPLSEQDRQVLDAYVREVLVVAAADAALHGHSGALASSGTMLALARMTAQTVDEDPAVLDGYRCSSDTLYSLCDELVRSDAAVRARMAGLEPRRADLMPAAAVLVRAILDEFSLDEVAFTTWGLREGLLIGEAEHPLFASSDPNRMRSRSILALGRRHRFDEMHGRQTARLATTLFDALAPALDLDPSWRELLEHAATIHDVGNAIARRGHHRHGAYLLRHAELAGFEPDDRALLEALVRWHRSGTPRSGAPEFDALDSERREVVAPLAAILRLADGLDSSRHANVLDVDAYVDDGRIAIRLRSTTGDPGLDLWGARRKAALLEQVSGRDVSILGPDDVVPVVAAAPTD